MRTLGQKFIVVPHGLKSAYWLTRPLNYQIRK